MAIIVENRNQEREQTAILLKIDADGCFESSPITPDRRVDFSEVLLTGGTGPWKKVLHRLLI